MHFYQFSSNFEVLNQDFVACDSMLKLSKKVVKKLAKPTLKEQGGSQTCTKSKSKLLERLPKVILNFNKD